MIKLIGILIVIIGFALKLDTIAVVLTAGVATGLVGDMSFTEILHTLGKTFVEQRHITLFILTLPVIGLCERYGLRERATQLISQAKSLSTGKLFSLYTLIRQIAGALSIRLGGHPQFIRPLISPMAQGAAISKYGEIDKKDEDRIKAAAAAMENYGNFFGQNLFLASSGVLLVMNTLNDLPLLKDAGVAITGLEVAKASIPAAVATLLVVIVQNYLLDKSLDKKYMNK